MLIIKVYIILHRQVQLRRAFCFKEYRTFFFSFFFLSFVFFSSFIQHDKTKIGANFSVVNSK